jgi:DNA-binding transcriptional MerR regulator
LSIHELKKLTGVPIPTIKRWSSRGLLTKPEMIYLGRGVGNKGLWDAVVLEEIKRIKELRKEGKDLDEIGEIMKGGKYRYRLTAGTGYFDEKKMATLLQFIGYQMMPQDVKPILAYEAANQKIRRFLAGVERDARQSQKERRGR